MKAKKKKKLKIKMEFSKRLAVLNTIVYLLVLLFCLAVWIMRSDFPSAIFNSVTAQYATTLSVYMVKAGVENYAKINNPDYNYDDKKGGF